MTEQDKQFLLKDLCARLPYGVIVDYKENEFEFPHWKITTIYPDTFDGWIGYDKRVGAGSESGSRPFKIGEVKPYLRPMSIMTEEEEKEIRMLHHCFYREGNGWITAGVFGTNDCGCTVFEMADMLNYLNEHHFDYRGLIEKGLALIAPEGMYKTE